MMVKNISACQSYCLMILILGMIAIMPSYNYAISNTKAKVEYTFSQSEEQKRTFEISVLKTDVKLAMAYPIILGLGVASFSLNTLIPESDQADIQNDRLIYQNYIHYRSGKVDLAKDLIFYPWAYTIMQSFAWNFQRNLFRYNEYSLSNSLEVNHAVAHLKKKALVNISLGIGSFITDVILLASSFDTEMGIRLDALDPYSMNDLRYNMVHDFNGLLIIYTLASGFLSNGHAYLELSRLYNKAYYTKIDSEAFIQKEIRHIKRVAAVKLGIGIPLLCVNLFHIGKTYDNKIFRNEDFVIIDGINSEGLESDNGQYDNSATRQILSYFATILAIPFINSAMRDIVHYNFYRKTKERAFNVFISPTQGGVQTNIGISF